jgi:hypothetical protein
MSCASQFVVAPLCSPYYPRAPFPTQYPCPSVPQGGTRPLLPTTHRLPLLPPPPNTQTQGETRPPLPTTHRLPLLAFTAKEVGIALVASVLRARHNRIEPVERVSVQPKGRSYSRTLFARGT